MCRGKNHGDRRCPHDTSEARKRRRRAAQGRELYQVPVAVDPEKQTVINPEKSTRSFRELQKESLLINALLHSPVHKDPAVQAEIDAKNELLVTRLGNALGEEADKRAGVDLEAFDEDWNNMSESFVEAASEMGKASRTMAIFDDALYKAKRGDNLKGTNIKADAAEIERLEKLVLEAKENHQKARQNWDHESSIDNARRRKIVNDAVSKMTGAYKSVIADIRPVGGEIEKHELSSEDAIQNMQETVGKDYPSSWIQASRDKGPIAIVSSHERANYSGYKSFGNATSKDLTGTLVYTTAYVPQSRVEHLIGKLSEGNPDSAQAPGAVLEISGDPKQYRWINFPTRVAMDPSKDKLDETGKPVGEGWKYGYVIENNPNELVLSEQKTWYRNHEKITPTMRAITVSPATHPDSKLHSYHEAVHSYEASVGDGAMMGRLQEAFLKRRTTFNGTRNRLVDIMAGQGTGGMEFVREGGFMDRYIGREYPENTVHREVISVGSEAMFIGKYGAFMGLDKRHNPDTDHRAFVLGMFASA